VLLVQPMIFQAELQEINLERLSPGLYHIMIRKGEKIILKTITTL
jgi:hypothetical protein